MSDAKPQNLSFPVNRRGSYLNWLHDLTVKGYKETPAIIFKSIHNGFIEQCFLNGETPDAALKKYKTKFATP